MLEMKSDVSCVLVSKSCIIVRGYFYLVNDMSPSILDKLNKTCIRIDVTFDQSKDQWLNEKV